MQVGNIETNCYIIYCRKTLQAAVIDPGDEAEKIIAAVNKNNLKVSFIILTHGHGDHIGALNEVRAATGAKVLIHSDDAGMLTNANKNLSVFIGASVVADKADRLLNEGDIIEIGDIKLKVIHTPGHTSGGICLFFDNTLIAGDTLFAQSIGRTDFPGGSYEQLIKGIKDKLFILPDDVKVFPGHGPATTIGLEKRMNPFVR